MNAVTIHAVFCFHTDARLACSGATVVCSGPRAVRGAHSSATASAGITQKAIVVCHPKLRASGTALSDADAAPSVMNTV